MEVRICGCFGNRCMRISSRSSLIRHSPHEPRRDGNLSHLWVLDKFRVVHRLALIFLRGRGGWSGLRRPIIAQFSAKKCALRAPAKLASAMRRSAASDPSRRLNLRTSSTMSALIRLGSATRVCSTAFSLRARVSAMKPSIKSLLISRPSPAGVIRFDCLHQIDVIEMAIRANQFGGHSGWDVRTLG